MLPEEFTKMAELEDHHWWFKARREIMYSILVRFSNPKHCFLGEIGCGTGGNLKFLQHYFRKTIGVDISPDAVALADKRTDCEVLQGKFADAFQPLWKDIDVILLADVIGHVKDDRAFFDDIVNSMQPGALLLVTAPAYPFLWSRHDEVLGHKRRYTRKSFFGLWENRPVSPLFFTYFNTVLFPVIALVRLLPKNRKKETSDVQSCSAPVNSLLYFAFIAEKFWLKFSGLPFGCSCLVLLRKDTQNERSRVRK